MIVYLITNLINNKQYVGYTQKSLEERIQTHIYKANSKNKKHYFYLLPMAIRKYGIENFKWEAIYETDDLNDVLEKEVYFIKELKTLSPNGYNLTKGGNGGIQSDETKLKISNSLKEFYKNNPHPTITISTEKRREMGKKAWETKNANGFIFPTGFTRSIESRLKMSETKNELNKHTWFNIKTQETIELSLKKMADYTNLSTGTFNHLKQGRQKQTKCGWTFIY